MCALLVAGCALRAAPAQPGQVVVPDELAFARPLVELLSRSGLRVRAVRASTFASMFPSTSQAAWIETDEGILDAVFFADPAEAQGIRITESPDHSQGRYIYILRAAPPTLTHDQTIDAAFPLYFIAGGGMFLITSSEEFSGDLKSILPGN